MRRLVLSALTVIALAVLGYTGFWFYLANRVQTELSPWAEARRTEGYTIRWNKVAIEGFPFALRLRYEQVVFGRTEPFPYDIAGPVFLSEARLWNLRHWQVSAPDGIRVQMPSEDIEVRGANMSGAVMLGTPDGTAIDLTAHDISSEHASEGLRVAQASLHLTVPETPPKNHLDTAFAATLNAASITLPQPIVPFGDTIAQLTFAGSFKGRLPPGPQRKALEEWRDDGGTIEIDEAAIQWGALTASTKGTLALDETLQPIGAFTTQIDDQNAVVDAAVATGNLREGDASFIKIFLGLMAKPGPDGKKHLTVPMSVQNDRVFLGPAEVAALPTFKWE